MCELKRKPSEIIKIEEWSATQVQALLRDLGKTHEKTPNGEEILHVNFLPGVWGCPKIVE